MDRCDRAAFAFRLPYANAFPNDRVGVLGAGKHGFGSHELGACHIGRLSVGKRLRVGAYSLAVYRSVILDDTRAVGGVNIGRGSYDTRPGGLTAGKQRRHRASNRL
jgi:hypothetical protein